MSIYRYDIDCESADLSKHVSNIFHLCQLATSYALDVSEEAVQMYIVTHR